MNSKYAFTQDIRIANFSSIELSATHVIQIGPEEATAVVKTLRRYADLPYVFVVAGDQIQKVQAVLAELKATRSPCYPYALFAINGPYHDLKGLDLEVVHTDSTDGSRLKGRINAYVAERFDFDYQELRVQSSSPLPDSVDVVIVGGGITGLYAANRLQQSGISFCVLEKREILGGIWSLFANATSRVNTSECAYRLVKDKIRSNRDHSSTREILEDLRHLSENVSSDIFLNTEVQKIEKQANGYRIACIRDGVSSVIACKGVILAINDRVGVPREIEWKDQANYKGEIVNGTSGAVDAVDWRNKRVVVVGMGAFAIENVRTALERGADLVTIVGRRHGTVCPKIIDYLNFTMPYDDAFQHEKKSNIRNMIYWRKLYEISGATPPECWMGRVKHDGHTISVSDIWFVGHFLGRIKTVAGSISRLYAGGVEVDGGRRIEADIVVNCIGFERNTPAVSSLCDYVETTNINYLDKDFMYLADAYIDDDAFNSFFGSSVLEMVKFYLEVFVRNLDKSRYSDLIDMDGITRIPIAERKWSDYIAGAKALIANDPGIAAIARQQVSERTHDFMQKHDLETYLAENKREWLDLHQMLAGKHLKAEECMPYIFDKLLPVDNAM
jgi:hypothetical protein